MHRLTVAVSLPDTGDQVVNFVGTEVEFIIWDGTDSNMLEAGDISSKVLSEVLSNV